MNRKLLLFIGVCLTIGLVAFHFRQFNSAPPAANPVANAPVQPAVAVHLQAEPVVNPVEKQEPAASPAAEIAVTRPEPIRPDDLTAALEIRIALMAQLCDWAAKDLAGALDFVSKMPAGEERDDALQAVCFGLAQKDPARAVELAQTLQQPEAVMENLVQQWAGSDLPAALVWVNDQPAGEQRDELFQRAALIVSETDPTDAAGLVLEQIPPGPAQDEAVMTVLNQWANKDLNAATLWVQNFPDTPLRERALEELEGIEKYHEDLARQ